MDRPASAGSSRNVRSMSALKDAHFVLTSTNSRQVEQYAKGDGYRVYEIIGKPFDLAEVAGAVREALKARATR